MSHSYYRTAIFSALTLGALWGALILLHIGLTGSFTTTDIHEINAHGHAQIYGWVGLVLIGILIKVLPEIWHFSWTSPKTLRFVLLALASGLVLSTIAHVTFHAHRFIETLFYFGQLLQLLALVTFATQVLTIKKKRTPSTDLIQAGVVLLPLSFLYTSWHHLMTLTAQSEEALLFQIATFQAPLRDLQVHGMALMLLFGLGLSTTSLSNKSGWGIFSLLVLGTLSEMAFFLIYRLTNNHLFAALLILPWLMLFSAALLYIVSLKVWRAEGPVKMAFLWLVTSLAMLLLLPLYQNFVGGTFSHAYYGAIRHAITVGFVSFMLMILVPRTLGITGPFTGPFILLNIGCAWRVFVQILTDWHPAAFFFVPISALIEFSALAWWGFKIWRPQQRL